jgi:hypothetical protein
MAEQHTYKVKYTQQNSVSCKDTKTQQNSNINSTNKWLSHKKGHKQENLKHKFLNKRNSKKVNSRKSKIINEASLKLDV